MNFMWSSMIWMTSLGYRSTLGTNYSTMLANRRNIVTETIAFMFLFIREDIVNARYCTSEPCEHTFAGWRCERCEATVEEALGIEDKRRRKVDAIFESGLAVHRDPRSGYQATWASFVQGSANMVDLMRKKQSGEAAGGGPVRVLTEDGTPPAQLLWPHIKAILNDCGQHMMRMLLRLGVCSKELSPFLKEFDSVTDLVVEYKRYCGVSTHGQEQNEGENYNEENPSPNIESGMGRTCQLDHLKDIIDLAQESDEGDSRPLVSSNLPVLTPRATNNQEAGEEDYHEEDNESDADLFVSSSVDGLFGWDELLQSSEEDLAETALKAFQQLSAKTRTSGSVHYETKRKSLKERWLSRTEPKETASELVEPQEKIIERNVHVKVEVTEKGNNVGPSKKAIEDYRVLGIYTKTYNKWFLCEHGKQVWKKGIRQGKYRVLLRMIQFDHSMGKWKDINLKEQRNKWVENGTYYILCDASHIIDVVEKLGYY